MAIGDRVIQRLSIPDVWTFTPPRFQDERGWFCETFNTSALATMLGSVSFVQDNQAMSKVGGTLRGMHFQIPPKAQDKLVRVVRGAVLDVAVDLRRASPTYGHWVSALLTAENGLQIFVPKGFAHGYLTLTPETEIAYKVSDYYSKEHERGIAWDDKALAIEWGVPTDSVLIAERDRRHPSLSEIEAYF